MREWDTGEDRHEGQASLEDRLAAYYGPDLRELPLPQSSWLRTQARLGPQPRVSRHLRLKPIRVHHRHIRSRATPAYIQDAFVRIVHETRMPWRAPLLRCAFNTRTRVPTVRVSPVGRHKITLVLPSDTTRSTEAPELDVLLATGLARYYYVRKLGYKLSWMLQAVVVLLVCGALILFGVYKYFLALLPIAILLCILILGLLYVQGRRLAFRGDALMVQWLGRSRVCRGLHALAERSRVRRGWRWLRWGEPTLGERIDRVCGTRVEVEEERLTLVR